MRVIVCDAELWGISTVWCGVVWDGMATATDADADADAVLGGDRIGWGLDKETSLLRMPMLY